MAGTTNRLTALFARRVMQGFPNTLKKGVWSGNPVRREIAQIIPPQERFEARDGKPKLLVLGGSRGALAINEILPKALAQIDSAICPDVFHQTGKTHLEATLKLYAAEDFDQDSDALTVVPFIESMEDVYEWADFVICRAGALTVAELTSAGLGALLIPFPYAIDDHQTANGQLLVDHGAAEMIQQINLTPENLAAIITDITMDSEKRLAMAINARALAKNGAAQQVADMCLEVANGQ